MLKALERVIYDAAHPIKSFKDFLYDAKQEWPPDKYGLDPKMANLSSFIYHNTLFKHYFRVDTFGVDNIPDGRCIIAANHSGILPFDGVNLGCVVHNQAERYPRYMVERYFKTLGPVYEYMKKNGAYVGTREMASQILQDDLPLIVFPGGAIDISKPWENRYQVRGVRGFRKGKGGYIRQAAKAGAPIIPTAIVGAEETYFMIKDLGGIVKEFGRKHEIKALSEIPFFPLLANILPVPSKHYIRFGEPIKTTPEDADDQGRIDYINMRVRGKIQWMLDDILCKRSGIVFSKLQEEPTP